MQGDTDDLKLAARILGPDAASFVPVLHRVVAGLGAPQYEFMSQSAYGELLQRDVADAMRVYWSEILYQAHFAAATSLVRSERWLAGVLESAGSENYTTFMACFRGFLEAAADTFHTLQDIPLDLADCHPIVRRALNGVLRTVTLAAHLEDPLIHFTHARYVKRGEEVPPTHRAKETMEYLESLSEPPGPKIAQCYRELCDVTHPGVGSIMCYATLTRGHTGTIYHLKAGTDPELIRLFCALYTDIMLRLVSLAVVPPAFILRVLNEFREPAVYTEAVMGIGLETRPTWADIQACLEDPALPKTRAPTRSNGVA